MKDLIKMKGFLAESRARLLIFKGKSKRVSMLDANLHIYINKYTFILLEIT